VSDPAVFSVSTALAILLGAIAASALAIAITFGGAGGRHDDAALSAASAPAPPQVSSAPSSSASQTELPQEFPVDTSDP
jgi:hypothetical protein